MLDSGFQSPGFRIPRAKNSWIPESGLPYMGRFPGPKGYRDFRETGLWAELTFEKTPGNVTGDKGKNRPIADRHVPSNDPTRPLFPSSY